MMKIHGRTRKEQRIDQAKNYNMMENKVSKQAKAAFHHKPFSIPSANEIKESLDDHKEKKTI